RTPEFSFCLCLLPLSKIPDDVILAREADWELNAGLSIMAHRKFAARPQGVSVLPDVGGRGGASLRRRRALAPLVLGAACGGAGRQCHGEGLAHLPVMTIQGRNAIFSLCDEGSAATCCGGTPPHNHFEEFRPVPPIASTIEHIEEPRLGARDQSCIRQAIGA